METKKIELEEGKSITVWRMNNGFKSDWNDKSIIISASEGPTDPKTGKATTKQERRVSNGNYRIYGMIYGILSTEGYNISEPKDLEIGLSETELDLRKRFVRTLDGRIADRVWNEILEINKVDEEKTESLKKN